MKLDRVIFVRETKTVYRDGDKAIKVFDNSYTKADVLNEALNQARIESTGLQVPAVLEVTKADGKWAIVSEFIEGETLAQLLREHPEKSDEYWNLFVDLQLTMHEARCPLLNKLKDRLFQKIMLTDLDATTRYDLLTRLEGMPKHNKVCHGDLNPTNIIVRPDGTPVMLDWSHAAQGNASADAARTYLWLCLEGAVETADRYFDMFSEKSGIEKKYVQKWLSIVAAAQLYKGNPKERGLLMHWVDVMDYE